jgi:type VI secretion system (T6SS) immunity protein Tdi1
MIPLVDASVASGLTLAEGQCYGYKIPPILGGQYEVSNVEPTDLSVHYAFLADIYRQTKDVPDGTPIRVVLTD